MSLTQQVALAIIDLGRASLDDLVLLFPEYTRRQVWQAMKNARAVGLISIVERGTRCRGGIYGPKVHPLPPVVHTAVRCVFTMATGGVRIPVSTGRQYSPLGPWTEGASA